MLKKELQKELDELEDDNRRWKSNQEYMNGLLEREERATRYQCNKVRELEEETKTLKNTPLWKKLWNDIKPKPRYSCGYSRWYKWEAFLTKLFWVMIAVVFAIIVFVGNYYLLKYANMYKRLY